MNTSCFDLLEAQRQVRGICCPKELFELWEKLSYAYLRNEVSKYILDEMKSVVWNQFRHIKEEKPFVVTMNQAMRAA